MFTKLIIVTLCWTGLTVLDLKAQEVLTPGFLRVDYFDDIVGSGIDIVTSDPRYPSSPTSTDYWNVFGPFAAGNHHGENFGARVTGFLIPPVTGDYKLYFRSDDAGQLWLSTDESETNATMVCTQTE